jgi:hypothetical protein
VHRLADFSVFSGISLTADPVAGENDRLKHPPGKVGGFGRKEARMGRLSPVVQKIALAALCAVILLLLATNRGESQPFNIIFPRNLPPRPANLPLNNGSLQSNLPGNIATLPLFLRNGGWFGFGYGAFGQMQANPPAGGVIIPMNEGLGGMGGKLGGLGGYYGGY